MQLIDTHCHIADANYPLDRVEVLAQARRAGVEKIITIGTDEVDSKSALALAESEARVWASVGLHPHEAMKGVEFLQDFDLKHPKIVAIGEIGLDYHYNFSPRADQEKVLRQQIELALAAELPIVFHVREAFADFWRITKDYEIKRAVVHSFSDTIDNLERVLNRGWLVGVNGLITFTKDLVQQAAFAAIPLDRLLLETDAPYMTPAPLRGQPNQPAYVRQIAEFIAKQNQLSLDVVAAATSRNAELLFSI